MAQFLIMHCGFSPPSPEQMDGWKQWFGAVGDRTVSQAGFGDAREITADGTTELPFGPDSITGYTVIEAADLDEATQLAADCPIVASTRVYALREG